MCDSDRLKIKGLCFCVLQGKFKQTNNGIHRCANFMAHGCQKLSFGPAGSIGLLFGLGQCRHEFHSITDINPATNNPLYDSMLIFIWLNPVIYIDWHTINMNTSVFAKYTPLKKSLLVLKIKLFGFLHPMLTFMRIFKQNFTFI